MRLATLFLTAALAVSTLAAQPGPRPGRDRERGPGFDQIKSYLGLSEEQAQQFQALRQSLRESVRTLMQDTRAKREQLREELARESPSPGIVGDLTVQLQQARKQAGEKRKEFGQQARAILTEEQQAKLAALEEAKALIPAIRQAQGLQLLEGENPDWPGFGPGPGPGPGFGRGPGFGPGPGARGPRPQGRGSGMGIGRGGARF